MKINKKRTKKIVKIVNSLMIELYSNKITFQEAAIVILSFEELMKENEPLLKEILEFKSDKNEIKYIG